jgi:MFS family permease
MTDTRKLLSYEFIGLCLIAFLANCNITVFYNLFSYLHSLGIPAQLCGVVIGIYSLTAMLLYLLASPFVNAANAPRCMLLGMTLVILCGFGYFFIHSFWGLLALRVVNGAAQFCIGAGVMALFVTVIPPEKSGQAFGIYSVAVLVAFACVPSLMDTLAPVISTPPHGYAAASLSMLLAAFVVWKVRGRRLERLEALLPKADLPTWGDIRISVSHLPVALLILLNMIYFANWSSLFFLFKGYAQLKGVTNVGSFFTVLTVVMMIMRVVGGRLFDSLDKVLLIAGSFVTVAVSHLALDHLPGTWAVPLVGVLFGLGMGTGYPAINGLMFFISPPRFRSLNSNLMLFALQSGFFLGPAIGGAMVAYFGYHGYFNISIGLSVVATLLCSLLARQRGRQTA